jgi:multicomponent Na+:H+ antiporter subunit C
MTGALIYKLAAVALFGIGWAGLMLRTAPLMRLIALNVMGLGVLMLLVAIAYRGDAPPDPVPHALAITGIVVAVAATGMGLVLIRRAKAARRGPDA